MKINYDQKVFRSVENSGSGDVGLDTIFYYRQNGELVWAEYKGGSVVFGTLIAKCDGNGVLDMRYQHLNDEGNLMTGTCKSTPEILPDSRIRLHEDWQWTAGDLSPGRSVIEEVIDHKRI